MNCAVIVAHVKSITNVLYLERKLIVRATTLKKLTTVCTWNVRILCGDRYTIVMLLLYKTMCDYQTYESCYWTVVSKGKVLITTINLSLLKLIEEKQIHEQLVLNPNGLTCRDLIDGVNRNIWPLLESNTNWIPLE